MKSIHAGKKLPDVVMPACEHRQVLKGQKALITGGNSGIGKGIAFALAGAGADVVINYVSQEEEAEVLVRELQRSHPQVHISKHFADVSNEEEVEEMFADVVKELGTIDILINNAGLQQDAPFQEMTLEEWKRVIDVNLTGQFLCARGAIREFLRRGVRPEVSCAAGKIICTSSVHEVIPWAGHVNYAASKGGIMMMMKSIAQEMAAHRIRVNSICPGAIQTPINRETWETPEAYQELMTLIPYNRIGTVEDIGRAAVWLASDDADYVTGISLFVDGGMTLYPGFTSGG